MGINAYSDLTYEQFEAEYGMQEEHHRGGHLHLKAARKERFDGGEREMQAR